MRSLRSASTVHEDAWGSDSEGIAAPAVQPFQSLTHASNLPAKTKQKNSLTDQGRTVQDHRDWQPAPGQQRAAASIHGPDTLYSICLGVLGEHLPDLLADQECAEALLPLLPIDARACLLAVARLRRLITDFSLLLLVDAGQSILDLHGCGSLLTDSGIQAALRRMPDLRHVDLRACAVSASTLRTLGECCPLVEVLRLGSPFTDASAARGLRDILPMLDDRHAAPAADSWDALLEVQHDEQALTAAVAGTGYLMQLQVVVWPNMPHSLAQHCKEVCPKVAVNPSAQHAAARRLPPHCNPDMAMDASLLAAVAGSQRWMAANEEPPAKPVMHIAEKFRLAYISRQQRVAAKMERNWQQQRRRALRRSQAEALIRQWESEL